NRNHPRNGACRGWIKSIRHLPDFEDLLGQCRLAQNAQQDAVKFCAGRFIELFERRLVAPGDGAQQPNQFGLHQHANPRTRSIGFCASPTIGPVPGKTGAQSPNAARHLGLEGITPKKAPWSPPSPEGCHWGTAPIARIIIAVEWRAVESESRRFSAIWDPARCAVVIAEIRARGAGGTRL